MNSSVKFSLLFVFSFLFGLLAPTLAQGASFYITVTKAGTGTGTVTSDLAGINCGNSCAAVYAQNFLVTLTAKPAAGSTFTGWTGACTGSAATCRIKMNSAKNVTATFATPFLPLTVTLTGGGAGTVTSSPAGINCTGNCTSNFTTNSTVTLTASAPPTGSIFAGWSGACTGKAITCSVTMTAAKTVTASFTAVPTVQLTVTKRGTGTGTVTSSPAGIDCGSTCIFKFNQSLNNRVILTATTAPGSTFTGWGNACSGTATTCSVSLAAAQPVAANFTLIPPPVLALTVTKTGTGTGAITSSPVGINCGSTCTANFNQNSSVVLTAAPAASSTFTGWTGACTGTALTCTVTLNASKTATASFTVVPTVQLTVTKRGTGTGTVTSSPTGIDCGSTCIFKFNQSLNNRVILTATPAPSSTFTGWGNACSGTATTCSVSLAAAQPVAANFTLIPPPVLALTVTKTGTGTGAITSSPVGINCGSTCTANFNQNSSVVLTAAPATGSTFTGWTGACTGTALTCTVTLNAAKMVTANFTLTPPPVLALTVTKTGTGTGAITSSPVGINCGSTCTANFNQNSSVVLTAAPATGSTFTGWTGACTGTALTCTVTLNAAKMVTASFTVKVLRVAALTVTKTGTGTVTSAPAGINCGSACTANFNQNSTVTLAATPSAGSTFAGWTGACTGTASTCAVSMNQAKTIGASFSPVAVVQNITTFQYDPNGNLTQVTDPLGRVRQTQYDGLGQAVRELEPDPTTPSQTLGKIDTQYDSLGQVKRITDPRNLSTDYQVDNLGNVLAQTSPDTGVSTNTYDEAGNLKTHTDSRGKKAAYSYDSENRPTQVSYDDQTLTYTWDNCTNGIGRLCGLMNGSVNLSFNYDVQGRITSRTQKDGSITLGDSHTYNTSGQLTQTTTPSQQVIGYGWQNDQIGTVSVNGQPLLTAIRYEADGQIGGWTWRNGVVSERRYDLDGRPASITLGIDPLSQQLDLRAYRYDAASRITGITDTLNVDANTTYGYDGLDRLIASRLGEFTVSNFNYAYDLSGNRTSKTVNSAMETHKIDPSSNRLLQKAGAKTIVYGYDAAGNILSDGSLTYAYNNKGQRISATGAGVNAAYAYNALGQRVRKTVNGVATLFYYDGQGHLTGEYDATGKMLQETVWLGDLPIALLQPASPQSSSIDMFYIHTDHLGTPRKLTRADNNKVVWTWDAEPFGNSPPNQNPSNLGNFVYNFRFLGQYYDQETWLHYNYFRDYDPANGRYIESDPIGLGGGINTYGYVGGNPLSLVDPAGLVDPSLGRGLLNTADKSKERRCLTDKITKRKLAYEALLAKLASGVPLTERDQFSLMYLESNRGSDAMKAASIGAGVAEGALLQGFSLGRGTVIGKAGPAMLKGAAKIGYEIAGDGLYQPKVVSTDPTQDWQIAMSNECKCP